MKNNSTKNILANILAIALLLITFIFIRNLFKTPESQTVYDTDGLEKKGGISPVVEQHSLVGRTSKIYAPDGRYFDIYNDAPRRGTISSYKPDGNTVDYIGNTIELLQFVRNSNGSWVYVYDRDANKQYWVVYDATLPNVPKVDWDN